MVPPDRRTNEIDTFGTELRRVATSYSYDAANQLTAAGATTYAYDSAGNRTSGGSTLWH